MKGALTKMIKLQVATDQEIGMQLHAKDPWHLLKGLLFHTVHVVQLDNSRLVFGDNFGIIIHKYPYSHILSSLLYHLSIAVLLGEAVLLYTHLNAISNSHEQ